ncbi:class I SAM-dependent methyltransferase [Heyndrickxia vini]|uniref:Class I SAM-dependent methyltransferase n=1 Tax=Heyndrickxia vini TaxID=1476025 RepID=A0ABX7E734_9BACI|nr:class I SAM-dependent methyltransferase [Heyndrickxia vini]QQZ11098.1 class I SAM-dependent methyltransferase [Heyndrickxia vini]
MIVTTAGRTNEQMIEKAKVIAKELDAEYIPRKKQSINKMKQLLDDDCIIIGKDRLELHPFQSDVPFFFHPNSASFRIKRLLRSELDPFIKATNLKNGSTILDCTMGLASDSIVASFVVGNRGKVYSLEGNKYLHYIVKKGLETWSSDIEEMNLAMKRIQTRNLDFKDVLKRLPDQFVDVIYFDPMFEDQILTSDGIAALRKFALYTGINDDIIYEATRVAKKRIVLKDHFRSERFAKYGFQVIERKSAKFHFGILKV